VHSNRTHFNQQSLKETAQVGRKTANLLKPSLHLMTVKFNSTGEAQNMSLKRNKNKTQQPKVCSV